MLPLHDGEFVTLVVALEQMKAGFAQRMDAARAREIVKLDLLLIKLRSERARRLHDSDGTPRM